MTKQPVINFARRGAVAVVRRRSRLLIIQRSLTVRAPGAYCFPGGGIEPDESEREAVVREFHEELGSVLTPLRRVWQSTTPWGVELAWWQATLDADALLQPNPIEVADFGWYTPDEMSQLPNLLPSNHDFLAALGRGEFVLE